MIYGEELRGPPLADRMSFRAHGNIIYIHFILKYCIPKVKLTKFQSSYLNTPTAEHLLFARFKFPWLPYVLVKV